jgi:hypothetical protein
MKNSWISLGMILLGSSLALNIGGVLQRSARAGYAQESTESFDHCHAHGDSNCKNWGTGHECYLCTNPVPPSELVTGETGFTHQQQSCGNKIMGECVDHGNDCDTGGNLPTNQACWTINVDTIIPQKSPKIDP